MSCDVPDCDGEVFGRDLCPKHYYRWLRHGSTRRRTPRQGLTDAELVRDRRAVGLADDGPSDEDKKRWHEQEMQGGART